MEYSDFIIYVDESGDHSLASIDADYPIFVLSFCIFRKSQYSAVASRDLQDFKFRWFGHDSIILHENDLVKQKPPFSFLRFGAIRDRFMNDLSDVLQMAPFTVISAVIQKQALKQKYFRPENPYQLALLFCLEKTRDFLESHGDSGQCHVVCESRSPREKAGRGKEDLELETEFQKIRAGQHPLQSSGASLPNFEIVFVPKQANSAGLQLADLIARPIGLHVLRPEQQNRAYDIIEHKIWKGPRHDRSGHGLKIFP